MRLTLGIALVALGIAIGFIVTFLFSWGQAIELFVGVLLVVAGVVVGFVVEWLIDLAYRRNRELQQQLNQQSNKTVTLDSSLGGDGQGDASDTLAGFLRQRDQELQDFREKLAEHDRQMDALHAEFDAYQRTHPDDLTVVKGIGPVYQWKLRDAGFNTYKQLASADPDQLRRMLDAKNWQRVNVEAWIEQARDWSQRDEQ